MTHRRNLLLLAALLAAIVLAVPTLAGPPGARSEYVGGTVEELVKEKSGRLETIHNHYLYFRSRKLELRVPYDRVNLLEYGQSVSRRYVLSILISPVFALAKSRRHFLTVGYQDNDGRQQALVFQVDKNDVRALLVSLEARTGLKVDYQDDEARRAGKG